MPDICINCGHEFEGSLFQRTCSECTKPKYLINGFRHMYDAFKSDEEYDYDFLFPKSGKYDFITNYLLYKLCLITGKIKKYDVVHINCWENFLNYKRIPGQLSICHSHGVHIGFDKKFGIAQSKGIKKLFSICFAGILHRLLRRSMKKFDIMYVSIPSALKYAKEVCTDSIWLPNPIDTDLFSPHKVQKLKGPAILFPTRFHKVKNPEFALKIFDKIKQEFPNAKLHIIDYPSRFSQDKNLEKYKNDIVIHPFMDHKDLAKFYCGFDLILGSFNEDNANLNMVELEAMACKVPVITCDYYELIKEPLENLPYIAVKILKNKRFKDRWIKRNYDYVRKVHSIKSVLRLHKENIKRLHESKLCKKCGIELSEEEWKGGDRCIQCI